MTRVHSEWLRKSVSICLCILLQLVLSGCAKWAASRPNSPILRYGKERLLDFADIGEIGVLVGKGARLDVRYGLGPFGAGYGHGYLVRLGQRYEGVIRNEWREAAVFPPPTNFVGGPLVLFTAMGLEKIGITGPMSFLANVYGTEGWTVALLLNGSYDREDPLRWQRWYEVISVVPVSFENYDGPDKLRWGKSGCVGAELTVGIGARVRVYPIEVLDFVIGLTTLDIIGDDATPPHAPEPVDAAPKVQAGILSQPLFCPQ